MKDVVAEREVGVDVEMMVTEEETVRLVVKTRTEQVVTKRGYARGHLYHGSRNNNNNNKAVR